MHGTRFSQVVVRILITGFVLRVVIPPGLMPAELNDGWFLKLCPDGVAAAWMESVLGHSHAHHGADETVPENCELGSGLNAPFATSDPLQATAFTAAPAAATVLHHRVVASRTIHAHHPRAPPFSSRSIFT